MPILLRRLGSGRRGPFQALRASEWLRISPFSLCRITQAGRSPGRQVLRRSTFFPSTLSFSRNAPRYARRPVYRDSALRPFTGREITDRFRKHPGLNVNNGITAWLEDYHRRTRTKQEKGSARLQKVVNFLRVIIRLKGFAAADLALSRPSCPIPRFRSFVPHVTYSREGQTLVTSLFRSVVPYIILREELHKRAYF